MRIPTRYSENSKAFHDYWTFEDGAQLLLRLGKVPSSKQATKMIPLLFEKDDLADDVVNEVFENAIFPQALQKITDFVMQKNGLDSASESAQKLASQMREIPTWLDYDKLELGRNVCNRSGKSGLIVLRNYSLMLGYQSAAINKPLIATGALHSGAVKRIADTTNFWFAVTGKNALQMDGKGFEQCLRTRIIHSYSRIMIKKNLPWQIDEQGEPLNYWDMLATYLGFSLIFIQGLRKLGIQISDKEAEAVYHMWKYIGYLIGIPSQIMPENDLDAIESLYLWSISQPEVDADSLQLAKALHLEPLTAPWPKLKFQKKFIQHVNLSFNYCLIGERSCELLNLPKTPYQKMVNLVIAANKIDQRLGELSSKYHKFQINHGRAEQQIITNRVNMPMH